MSYPNLLLLISSVLSHRVHFKNNSISNSFAKGTERAKEIIIELEEAKFNLEVHLANNNRNNAQYNRGCGCEYCKVRARLAEEKIRLSKLQRAFDSELYFYARRQEETEQEAINAFLREKTERKTIISEFKERKKQFEKDLQEMGVDIKLLEKTI